MSILLVASFMTVGAGAVALFGLSAATTRHNVVYGIGGFIPAAAFVARFAVDRAKQR